MVSQRQTRHENALQRHVLTNYSCALKFLVFSPIQIHTGMNEHSHAGPLSQAA